jgi:hypothetical protein
MIVLCLTVSLPIMTVMALVYLALYLVYLPVALVIARALRLRGRSDWDRPVLEPLEALRRWVTNGLTRLGLAGRDF